LALRACKLDWLGSDLSDKSSAIDTVILDIYYLISRYFIFYLIIFIFRSLQSEVPNGASDAVKATIELLLDINPLSVPPIFSPSERKKDSG